MPWLARLRTARTLDRPRGPLATEVLEALVIELTSLSCTWSRPCIRLTPLPSVRPLQALVMRHGTACGPTVARGWVGLSRSRTGVVRSRSAQRHDPVIPGLRHRHPPLTRDVRSPSSCCHEPRVPDAASGGRGCGFTASSSRLLGPRGVHERGACRRRAREAVDYFLCGPGPMIATATRIVSDRGAPSRRIRIDLLDVA